MIVPILIIAIGLILAYIGSHKKLSRGQFLMVAIFFITGIVLVLFPGLANRFAQALNVGRGADLLLYFAVLSGVLVAANFYFRLKQNERVLVEVVRRVALLAPLQPNASEISERMLNQC